MVLGYGVIKPEVRQKVGVGKEPKNNILEDILLI